MNENEALERIEQITRETGEALRSMRSDALSSIAEGVVVMTAEHDHGVRIVKCAGCGQERWCGFGPCSACGALTPCPGVSA
jgi:hypothetical protein